MTIEKESTHMTLSLNSLPNSTLLCTFQSHKVPKLIQSPTCFPLFIPNPPTVVRGSSKPPHPRPLLGTLLHLLLKSSFGDHLL